MSKNPNGIISNKQIIKTLDKDKNMPNRIQMIYSHCKKYGFSEADRKVLLNYIMTRASL